MLKLKSHDGKNKKTVDQSKGRNESSCVMNGEGRGRGEETQLWYDSRNVFTHRLELAFSFKSARESDLRLWPKINFAVMTQTTLPDSPLLPPLEFYSGVGEFAFIKIDLQLITKMHAKNITHRTLHRIAALIAAKTWREWKEGMAEHNGGDCVIKLVHPKKQKTKKHAIHSWFVSQWTMERHLYLFKPNIRLCIFFCIHVCNQGSKSGNS